MISIDCTKVEYTVSQRSELDWLAYNAPPDHAKLVLCGDLAGDLRQVPGPHSGMEVNS